MLETHPFTPYLALQSAQLHLAALLVTCKSRCDGDNVMEHRGAFWEPGGHPVHHACTDISGTGHPAPNWSLLQCLQGLHRQRFVSRLSMATRIRVEQQQNACKWAVKLLSHARGAAAGFVHRRMCRRVHR